MSKSVRMNSWKIILMVLIQVGAMFWRQKTEEFVRARVLKFFQTGYRRVPDVYYVRWLSQIN